MYSIIGFGNDVNLYDYIGLKKLNLIYVNNENYIEFLSDIYIVVEICR